MKQMIIKLDDDYSETVKGLHIHGQLTGSKSWYNKVLVLALSDKGILELEDQFEELELSWSVIAIEDEPLNLEEFKSYMNDIIEYDEEGQETSAKEFFDLSTIQTFAGRKWSY